MLGLPNLFACTGVETENAFVSDRLFDDEIGQVKHAVGDDRGGIAEADRNLPFGKETRGREGGKNAGLGPDAVAIRSAPLRPVRGKDRSLNQEDKDPKGAFHEMPVCREPSPNIADAEGALWKN